MNPKFEVTIQGANGLKLSDKDMQRLIEMMKTSFEPSPEEVDRRLRAVATEALARLKPEDLDHEQRVGLFNRLVGLLAGGR